MKNSFQPLLIGLFMITVILFGWYLYLQFYYYIQKSFKIKVILISYYIILCTDIIFIWNSIILGLEKFSRIIND